MKLQKILTAEERKKIKSLIGDLSNESGSYWMKVEQLNKNEKWANLIMRRNAIRIYTLMVKSNKKFWYAKDLARDLKISRRGVASACTMLAFMKKPRIRYKARFITPKISKQPSVVYRIKII